MLMLVSFQILVYAKQPLGPTPNIVPRAINTLCGCIPALPNLSNILINKKSSCTILWAHNLLKTWEVRMETWLSHPLNYIKPK
jgi:hypothetical protein